MDRARFAEFYRRTVAERLALLVEQGQLSAGGLALLQQRGALLDVSVADKMVENVIGVFGLPMGLGLNFLIDGRDYVVPLVVEEPSIIAALSSAAKLVRPHGGFVANSDTSLLIGQVHLVDLVDPQSAAAVVLAHQDELLERANSLHPNMRERGGGAREVRTRIVDLPDSSQVVLVVHLLVDTCDAMGANLVNTMCEGIAARLGELSGGRPILRILSNLTDGAMVTARCSIAAETLGRGSMTGQSVRDAIVLANDIARVDPYRAATHNKGIFNGIDAVALATGNDWRAIEAGAHAFAGRGMGYTALTQWCVGPGGTLQGSLHLPLKVGTVGGNLKVNPAVDIAHGLMGYPTARELAHVMAAVGLAQNLAALRALVTDGIQHGHMTLHARSVAASAGVPASVFDAVVARLVASGEIKQWKAAAILRSLQPPEAPPPTATMQAVAKASPQACCKPADAQQACGLGKVLLAGEHAVVYGSHALAVPIALAMRTHVHRTQSPGVHLSIPVWGVEERLHKGAAKNSLHQSLHLILQRLALLDEDMAITVQAEVPRAMGLGGSAALAVSVVRGLSAHFGLNLADAAVTALAFEAEKVAHGNPSGVDNALASFARPLLFRRGEPPSITPVRVTQAFSLVVGLSRSESLTAKTVAQVRAGWQRHAKLYEQIFADIDSLTLQAAEAMQAHHLGLLGELMNINHGLLNALQVSTSELENMVAVCRRHGALGAKLTGGGGGGSVVALCPDDPHGVVAALQHAGYRAFVTQVGPCDAAALNIAR